MKITETNSGIIGGMKGKEKCFLIKSKSNENLILNQKVYSGPNSAKRLHTQSVEVIHTNRVTLLPAKKILSFTSYKG